MRDECGKSLIELSISLAVTSIVIALAAIGSGFMSEDHIKSFSRELSGDLLRLRYSSMTQGSAEDISYMSGYGARFENANTYYLFRLNDIDRDFTYSGTAEEAPFPEQKAVIKRQVPAALNLKIKEKGGLVTPQNNVLIFDRRGIPRQPSGGIQMLTLVVENPENSGARKKCVSITFTRVREGLWNGGDCLEQ